MIKKTHYAIKFSKQAEKDLQKLDPHLKKKLHDILKKIIAVNPYEGKKLIGELLGNYSYRLSFKDRIVYDIIENKKIINLKRVRTHYGD